MGQPLTEMSNGQLRLVSSAGIQMVSIQVEWMELMLTELLVLQMANYY
jgi:hypothetical protein